MTFLNKIFYLYNIMSSIDDTYNNFNSLISQASTTLLCGPECQKKKTAEEFQKQYLAAKVNVKTAPIELNEAAKKYYTFTKGVAGYNKYIKDELDDEAAKTAEKLTNVFQNNMNNAKLLNDVYTSQLASAQYAQQVYNQYVFKNKDLENQLTNSDVDINTNERKTYYEDQEIANVRWWYNIFIKIYAFIVFGYLLCFFFINSKYSRFTRILGFLLLAVFPFIVMKIALFFIYIMNKIYRFFYSILPKNIYFNL